MNIERTRIHFLSDVFASAAVLGVTYLQLELEGTLNRRSTSGTLNTPSSLYNKSLLLRGEGGEPQRWNRFPLTSWSLYNYGKQMK